MVVFDLASKQAKLQELEEKTHKPHIWQDPKKAQALMRDLARLKQQVEPWLNLQKEAEELAGLIEMAIEDRESELESEFREQLERLEKDFETLRLSTLLSGEHDEKDAIISINPGAGGTDACDWAEMLARMYRRWAERKGYQFQVVDVLEHEEAGLKSFTAVVRGPYAYGYLKAERGVHRLVRLSPFDADRQRHTSFAAVDVIPDIGEDLTVEIRDDDLKIDTFLASAKGGQNVQKNETAVRITHLPTGIVVSCQSERSQHRNRAIAMEILRSRLYEIEQRKHEEEIAKLRGEVRDIAFGHQIRSYVLHPYQLVKDHRTDYETSSVEAVLDGEIDEFIRRYLESEGGNRGA